MMYDMPQYIPQGWQCPVCKRVYSPDVRSCDYCGEVTITGTNIGKVPDIGMSVYEKATLQAIIMHES